MTAAWPFAPAGHCFYCDREVIYVRNTPGTPTPEYAATRDHVKPIARGGRRGRKTVLACRGCNSDKGQLTLEEYRVVVAFRKGWLRNAGLRFPGEE